MAYIGQAPSEALATSADIGANAVIASAIADGAVGSTELASSAVTTAKIADGNVTAAKLGTVYAANITGLGAFATTSSLYTANISDIGTIATQAANNVNITGGSASGLTSLGVTTLTATDATLSGNLTVNGTVTTINSTTLTIDDKNIELASTASPSDAAADGGGITLKGNSDKTITWSNTTKAWTLNQGLNLQQIIENATISSTALSGQANVNVLDGSIINYTANATANWTFNIQGNATTTLNTIMPSNASISVALMCPQGSTAYYPNVKIDGTLVTPKWLGGTTPTGGNTASTDIYAITVVKTASGTYTVYASQSQFA